MNIGRWSLLLFISCMVQAFPDMNDPASSALAEDGVEGSKITRGGNASDPQFAYDPVGNAFVVWRELVGPQYSLYAVRYLAASGWQQKVLLSTHVVMSDPSIVIDPAGNALVIWTEDVGGAVNNVFVARYVVNSGWRAKQNLSNSNGSAYLPMVAFDTMGNAMVVWRESVNAVFTVYAIRFALASGWGQKIKIS